MNIKVHSFTTVHKENFTIEFELTKEIAERINAFKDDWEHYNIELQDIDEQTSVNSIEQAIKSRISVPSYDLDGGQIHYCMYKVNDPNVLQPIPSKTVLAEWLRSIGMRLDNDKTLYEQNIEDGDVLVYCPGLHAGGPDYLTIMASIATIAQLLLMVSELWSAKRKASSSSKKILHNKQTHNKLIKEIRICMEDGNWFHFDESQNRPEIVKRFVENFSRFGTSVKPDYAIIVFQDMTKAKLKLSTSVDRENLNELLDMFETIPPLIS